MAKPNVLILRAPGSNCDRELQFAFELAGASVQRWHIRQLRQSPNRLRDFQILAVPGGFSYGDDIAAGKILAVQLAHFLSDALREFRHSDKLILGICNGFQALLKAGLFLPPDEDGPQATLTANISGRFEDRWIHLAVRPGRCPFLTGLNRLYLPVAHGEGRFLCRQEWLARGLEESGQAVLQYVDEQGRSGNYPVNPNGSQRHIAGLCDATGRVLGLMPHPERHVLPTHHPEWTRHGLGDRPDGLAVFRNAVDFFAAS